MITDNIYHQKLVSDYIDHGFAPIPIGYKSKQPVNKGWPELRISHNDIGAYFNEQPINIGILTGQPSQGLADIDIDDTAALRFAPWFLPETKCVFGRASKPKSHWVYRVPKPKAHEQFKAEGMILEIRGNNRCTVFPGSVHETGEPIEFENPENATQSATFTSTSPALPLRGDRSHIEVCVCPASPDCQREDRGQLPSGADQGCSLQDTHCPHR